MIFESPRRSEFIRMIAGIKAEELLFVCNYLTARAEEIGKVVTIETVPRQPLAMGNYDMVVHIRNAR